MNLNTNKTIRILLMLIGTFSVGIGVIGIFIPLLPTTPFLLLAAACYLRSSERLYSWLLTNRYFGRYIKNYRDGKGVPYKVKLFTVSLLWITILYSGAYHVTNVYVRIFLILIATSVTIHIKLVPTTEEVLLA